MRMRSIQTRWKFWRASPRWPWAWRRCNAPHRQKLNHRRFPDQPKRPLPPKPLRRDLHLNPNRRTRLKLSRGLSKRRHKLLKQKPRLQRPRRLRPKLCLKQSRRKALAPRKTRQLRLRKNKRFRRRLPLLPSLKQLQAPAPSLFPHPKLGQLCRRLRHRNHHPRRFFPSTRRRSAARAVLVSANLSCRSMSVKKSGVCTTMRVAMRVCWFRKSNFTTNRK